MKRNGKNGIFKVIGMLLLFISLWSCGQNRQNKTTAIINKLKLVETQKSNFEYQLEPLKYQAIGNDSIRLIEIEEKLTEEEVLKRISEAFDEIFNDTEIDDIYNFIQTSAFEKFFNSGETYKAISDHFTDIDAEIEQITNNFSELIEEPSKIFEPIPIDRENGFYATIDYTPSTEDRDIKLEDKPSLTAKDILEVKKVYSKSNDNRPEISIVLTKEGAQKLFVLTKENIGNPIAIVVANHIVSMPTVLEEIIGGEVSISGNFSEQEIDDMVVKLKGN